MQKRDFAERIARARTILEPCLFYQKNGLDQRMNTILSDLARIEAEVMEFKMTNRQLPPYRKSHLHHGDDD